MSSSKKFDIADLLRDPGAFVAEAKEAGGFGRLVAFLATLTLVGTSLFGFALGAFVNAPGAFADWRVVALDGLKLPGIVAFAFVLCYPTLYVFACISGSRLSAARLLGLGLVSTATLGCLLAALAPILWLFAVSTESIGFIVIFASTLGAFALAFASRPFGQAVAKGVVASAAGLKVWFAIFIIVALQAITLVRPMLTAADAPREPEGKCFFLRHFAKTVFEAN